VSRRRRVRRKPLYTYIVVGIFGALLVFLMAALFVVATATWHASVPSSAPSRPVRGL